MRTTTRVIVCAAVLQLVIVSLQICAQIPEGFGKTPIFDEEFSETHLNTDIWSYRGVGKRDFCQIDPSAVSVNDGYVRIRIYTAKDSTGRKVNYCGAIATRPQFMHAYGYWEAAVRFKSQPGMQTSFWLQSPTIGKWIGNPQKSGVEMDVFEHTSGHPDPLAYDQALHWDGYQPGVHKSQAHNDILPNLQDGQFHVFGVAWTPENVEFYIDGKLSWRLSGRVVPVSQVPEYMILDTELPRADHIPSQGYGKMGSQENAYLDVKYVRVYPYQR